MHKWMIITGALFSLTSVVLGAFAAHGLKNILPEVSITVFQTATQYQMFHGIALILCGIFSLQLQQTKTNTYWLNVAAVCFLSGILFFSGSLYGLALSGPGWLGPITPVGGLLFIIGWASLALAAVKIKV